MPLKLSTWALYTESELKKESGACYNEYCSYNLKYGIHQLLSTVHILMKSHAQITTIKSHTDCMLQHAMS